MNEGADFGGKRGISPARQMRGRRAYLGGLAAEEGVAAHYALAGLPLVARRWRGKAGEIDLIAGDGSAVVFIEVKQAETHAAAAERLSLAQRGRICAAAGEYLAGLPLGLETPARFDVALVDGQGRVAVLENAFGMT